MKSISSEQIEPRSVKRDTANATNEARKQRQQARAGTAMISVLRK